MELTQAYLKSILHYDPETGVFTRLADKGSAKIGDIADSLDSRGYIRIRIDGRRYQSHRLAFLYVMGSFPPHEIDHINRTRNDNRWCNLRPVTRRENSKNCRQHLGNTSGIAGVVWHKQAKQWQAQIKYNGRNIYLGIFRLLEDAALVRASAEVKYGFHKNHGCSDE